MHLERCILSTLNTGDFQGHLPELKDGVRLRMEEEKTIEVVTVEGVLGGKWFWPIISQMHEWETQLMKLIPFVGQVLSDDGPEWAFRCLLDVVRADSEVNGACDVETMGARAVGRMLGVKLSICQAWQQADAQLKLRTLKQSQQFDESHNCPGFAEEITEFYRRLMCEFVPLVEKIEKAALLLALDQCLSEKVEFMRGLADGMQFMDVVGRRVRPATTIREKQAVARLLVYHFAMVYGAEIEAQKRRKSWPELHKQFLEFVEYRVDIDEETFKKLLSRRGLRDVGKVGRRAATPKFRVRLKSIDLDPEPAATK